MKMNDIHNVFEFEFGLALPLLNYSQCGELN
jgi:hypothetical protein